MSGRTITHGPLPSVLPKAFYYFPLHSPTRSLSE